MSQKTQGKTFTIETPRLRIRSFAVSDWSGFQALTEDYNASNGGTYEGKWPTSEEHCKNSVEFMSTCENYFAVCLQKTGQLIAMLVLNGMDCDGQMDLGYIVHTQYQDNDHDNEALSAVMHYLFREREVCSIVVRWVPEWTEQFRVPTLLGFASVTERPGEMVLTKQCWMQRHAH